MMLHYIKLFLHRIKLCGNYCLYCMINVHETLDILDVEERRKSTSELMQDELEPIDSGKILDKMIQNCEAELERRRIEAASKRWDDSDVNEILKYSRE